jgi:uncharacterized protein YkwD
MLHEINSWRHSQGLHRVEMVTGLRQSAKAWTKTELDRQFFGHGDFPARLSYRGSCGEVLAYGALTPPDLFRCWLRSPAHRRVIAHPRWREVGIDARTGVFHGHLVVMWVVDFGDPS